MSQQAVVSPAFLDQILTLLAPLFLAAAGGDSEAARDAVRQTLAEHRARNDNELRLSALVVAFGFGALDALSKAANKDLSLDEVMDLRDSAIALSTAEHQSQLTLDKLQKRPPTAAMPADLPASAESRDLVAFASSFDADAQGGQRKSAAKASRDAPRAGRETMH